MAKRQKGGRPKNNFSNRVRILLGAARRSGLIDRRGSHPSIYALADRIADENGIDLSGLPKRDRFDAVVDWLQGRAKPQQIALEVAAPHRSERDAFYLSWEWRTLRMVILKAHGHRCQSCGAKPEPGNDVVITVDHIKPLSKRWELRLDPSNLQVLCDACNMGKGAWDETDYRSPSLAGGQ